MDQERPFKGRVLVRFVRRDDGGLKAYCSQVPGFFLSSIDRRAVMGDVIPALELLLKRNFKLNAHVSPLGHGLYELIEHSQHVIPDLPEYAQEYVVDPIAA